MKSKTTATMLLIFVVFLIAACNQAKKQQQEVIQKTVTPAAATAEAPTGNAAVDSVGQDISNVDNIEKDLNTDQLGDLDAGLQDIQDI